MMETMSNALTMQDNGAGSGITLGESGQLQQVLGELGIMMQGMADMMRLTNERMTALEQQVKQLEKVTPAQMRDMQETIREKAAQVCREYRMAGGESKVAAAIRKRVRLITGAGSMREVPRCDYETVLGAVACWEEVKTIRAIRVKVQEQESK